MYKKCVEVLTTTSIDGVKWLLESLTQDKGYKCISIRYKTLKNGEIRELSNFNKFEKAVSKHKNNSIEMVVDCDYEKNKIRITVTRKKG